MAKHKPQDSHENLSPDGGQAKTPKGAKEAMAAFEEALRRGSTGDLNKDPQEDTGARPIPA